VTVATFEPQGVAIAGVGTVAHAVGVVVHFNTRDVATGDTDMKRDIRDTDASEGSEPRPATPR